MASAPLLPAAPVLAIRALPPRLLATTLAAGHAEHAANWDVAVRVPLLISLVARLINVSN